MCSKHCKAAVHGRCQYRQLSPLLAAAFYVLTHTSALSPKQPQERVCNICLMRMCLSATLSCLCCVQVLEHDLKQSYTTKNFTLKSGLLELEKRYRSDDSLKADTAMQFGHSTIIKARLQAAYCRAAWVDGSNSSPLCVYVLLNPILPSQLFATRSVHWTSCQLCCAVLWCACAVQGAHERGSHHGSILG